METRTRNALIALLAVCGFSFYILLSIGSDIYREAPPLPQTVMDTSGNQVFSYQDIDTGQLAWRSMGGHQLGSIWGHGAYVAPDWTADWLHQEQQAWLNIRAEQEHGRQFDELDHDQQLLLTDGYRREARTNTYDSATGSIRISTTRAAAIAQVQRHYVSLFGNGEDTAALRDDYAMKNNTLGTLERREAFAAFVFWTAWAAITERPGEDYTYTNNWPYDPSMGNTITPDSVFWSILSMVLLLAGIGALAWYHSAIKQDDLPPLTEDPRPARWREPGDIFGRGGRG